MLFLYPVNLQVSLVCKSYYHLKEVRVYKWGKGGKQGLVVCISKSFCTHFETLPFHLTNKNNIFSSFYNHILIDPL